MARSNGEPRSQVFYAGVVFLHLTAKTTALPETSPERRNNFVAKPILLRALQHAARTEYYCAGAFFGVEAGARYMGGVFSRYGRAFTDLVRPICDGGDYDHSDDQYPRCDFRHGGFGFLQSLPKGRTLNLCGSFSCISSVSLECGG